VGALSVREFLMPTLGADMESGTLAAWRKQPGEMLHRGEIIAEVDTDKGVIDVEVFHDGRLVEQLVEPGTKVPVGTPLARLEPVAAGEQSLPVRGVAAAGTPEERPPESAERNERLRRATAAAMAASKRKIPHYYLATSIDMHSAVDWLASANEGRSIEQRLLPGVLLLKAAALAAREVPEINARWEAAGGEQCGDGGRAVTSGRVHLGVAIHLKGGGLVAPALHDADRRGLDDLMQGLRDLTERVRRGRMRSSELADATLTVTSLGDRGVERVYGVIRPPQAAVVGFGKIFERPWAVDGRVVVRPIVVATLAADHRVSDGHRGGRYLEAIDRLLQNPQRLEQAEDRA